MVVVVPIKRTNLILVALDLVGLTVIMWLVERLRFGVWLINYGWPLVLFVSVVLSALYVANAYGPDVAESPRPYLTRVLAGIALGGVVLIALAYGIGNVRLRAAPIFWRSIMPFTLFGFALWACITRHLMMALVRSRNRRRRWLVIGSGERVRRFAADFEAAQMAGQIHLLDEPAGGDVVAGGARHSGNMATLPAQLARGWSGVIVAADENLSAAAMNQLMRARLAGTRVFDLTDFYEHYWQKIPLLRVSDDWLIYTDGFRLIHQQYRSNAKQFLDYVLAGVVSVLSAPLLVLIAIAIRLDSPGPALYRQQRVGKGRCAIDLFKLRTMQVDAEHSGAQWAEEDDPRITRVGRCLRRYRIDEIPQFWNVLRGEMSCIGPRPERLEFVELLEQEIPYYGLRHLVKPGITGWAQVMHSYGATVEAAGRKLEYDLYYIKNHSLVLDFFILLKTLRVMLFGYGR